MIHLFRNLLLILLIAGIFTSLTAIEKFVARIVQPDAGKIEYLQKNDYDIAGGNTTDYIDIVATREQYNELQSRGFNIRIEKTEAEVIEDLNAAEGRPIAGYREYDELVADLEQYANDYPEICQLYDIGDSWGIEYAQDGYSYYDDFQHEIWAMKVSDNVNESEDEPAIYYLGAHHSREPISTEVCMTVLDYILTNYGIDDQITNDVDTKEIWFVPRVNPNGAKIVLDQTDIWWRKNIRDNNNNHNFNSDYETGTGDDGVDLNRNYGFAWGNVGSTDNPNGSTYHGPEEFSEPETQAVRDLINSRHFVAGISYHTHGELVLAPYGYGNDIYPPDADAIMDLCENVAENIDAVGYGHYTPQYSYVLYPTMGGLDDWAYGVHGIFGYTVEMATEFIPSASEIPGICNDNLPGALELLHRIDYNTITGIITDANTGQPMVGEIFIDGIDNTGEYRDPYKSDEEFGRYYRMVMPGAYNVTYSVYGYQPVTQVIVVNDNEVVTNDVSLVPSTTTDFHGIVRSGQTFAPVAGAEVTLHGTPFEPVITDANGEFSFDGVAKGTFTVTAAADGFGLTTREIDLNYVNNQQLFLYQAYLYDDMESTTNYWDFTGSWGYTSSSFYSPTQSITDSPNGQYNNYTNSYCNFSETVDLSDATSASFSFYAKVATEPDYDFVYLRVYGEDGSYVTFDSFTGNVDWDYYEYNLSDYIGQSNVSMQFYFSSDTYVTDDGFYFDDFKIFRDQDLNITYGDVDESGTLTEDDALYIMQYAAGLDPLESIDPRPWEDFRAVTADVDGNGLVKSCDAALLQQYIDGTIDEFPVNDPDMTVTPAEVTITVTDDFFVFSTENDSDIIGFDLTCWATENVFPGQPEILAENVESAEYIGDVISTLSIMSTDGFDGTFLRIPYTTQGQAESFTFMLDVNSNSVEYIVDMDPSSADEPPMFTDQLFGNYPNPFNPTTSIRFSLSKKTDVEITIYNIRGQRVKKLVAESFSAGNHQVTWNGTDDREQPVASGIYLYRFKAGNLTENRKALLLK